MIKEILEYLIPTSYKDNREKYRKARIAVGSYLLVFFFYLGFFVFSYYIEFHLSFWVNIVTLCLIVVCIFLFKYKIKPAFVNILLGIINMLALSAFVYFTKGFESFAIPWISIIPVFSLLVTNKRLAFVTLITTLLVIIGFFILSKMGIESKQAFNPKHIDIYRLVAYLGLTLILYYIAVIFENINIFSINNIAIKNQMLDSQKMILEIKQKEILDSINYAQKIQKSILPSKTYINQLFKNNFVLYKPKDIVSGDFYWFTQWGNKTLFAAVDCTGHGVPGALMSIVGQNILDKTVNEYGIDKPGVILDELNKGVYKTIHFNMEEEDDNLRDGMDIACCSVDFKNMKLEFAGAYNTVWILRNNNIIEYMGDKFPIGNKESFNKKYSNLEIDLKVNDIIYVFTDGFADQFGGPQKKKFGRKRMKELILSISDLPMELQKIKLNDSYEAWRTQGNEDQIDDVLVIGVKV
jgi:serine phosphatase RsbU (regulator of sigma subunit)